MNNVDTAVVKSQRQTWGEKTAKAERATRPGIAETSPREAAATESPGGKKTAPKGLWAHRHVRIPRPGQHSPETGLFPWK